MCHLYIFLANYLFTSFAHFFHWIVLFLSCKLSVYILDTSPLSNMYFKNILSQSVIINFDEVYLIYQLFFYLTCFLCSIYKKIIQPNITKVFSCVSLTIFIILGFTFRFIIHFELIFAYGLT